MMDAFLDFMLGPMRSIGNFYFEYQTILNTFVIGIALYKIIANKKKRPKNGSVTNKNGPL